MSDDASERAGALVSIELAPQELADRLRGLPLYDVLELDRAVGFVRLVRALVAAPLMSLGLLAAVAGLAVGHFPLAILAAATTALIVYALRHDTQLTTALEQLRRGELHAAELGMRSVAMGPDRTLPQRQRARAYLAAIAWARTDHPAALEWTRARSEHLRRGPSEERFRCEATEVLLLALLGRGDEARRGLASLGPPPEAEDLRAVWSLAVLAVAFAARDPGLIGPELMAEGGPELARVDDIGWATALFAWAQDAHGRREDATWLVERVRGLRGAPAYLRAHAPGLWRWVEGFERAGGRHYG